jgi:aromatic-L-amino-acid decarboxylase
MPKLDPTSDDFVRAAHATVDWIANYIDTIDSVEVVSKANPGDIEKLFASVPSESGKSYDELLGEFKEKILPGITHWNHPSFFAYFSITGSQAGLIGEMLTAAINSNGMVWKTSPSLTELEVVALRWLRDVLGLPDNLFGIINDTASVNTFHALAAAREALGLDVRRNGMSELPPLTVYCSEHAHVSTEKACLALGLGYANVVKIASDEEHRMRVDLLEEAIVRDRAAGKIPCAIVATAGNTSTGAIDPVRAIGEIARRENVWLHVDAAYAGSSTICPEFRYLWDGIELADSLVTNPHKWLFTQIDCSVLYTKRPDVLRAAFSPAETPPYLTLSDAANVNYMDYGLAMGRRFRALKLWLVLEHYGMERLRAVIRDQISWAARLAHELTARGDIEILAPQRFSLVVFRKVVRDESGSVDESASEKATQELMDRINAARTIYVSTTRLRGKLGVRVAIGNGATEWRHVARILEFM